MDRVAGSIRSGPREVTRADLLARAARAASGFVALGVGPGDCVALLLRNDFPFLEASYAAATIGGYAVPINWHWKPDEDGFLFLCDRKRDMVISGGVNIYPAEIEAVLIGVDGVLDCAVFGVPDAEFGEAVRAAVRAAVQAGDGTTEAAIRTGGMPDARSERGRSGFGGGTSAVLASLIAAPPRGGSQ